MLSWNAGLNPNGRQNSGCPNSMQCSHKYCLWDYGTQYICYVGPGEQSEPKLLIFWRKFSFLDQFTVIMEFNKVFFYYWYCFVHLNPNQRNPDVSWTVEMIFNWIVHLNPSQKDHVVHWHPAKMCSGVVIDFLLDVTILYCIFVLLIMDHFCFIEKHYRYMNV